MNFKYLDDPEMRSITISLTQEEAAILCALTCCVRGDEREGTPRATVRQFGDGLAAAFGNDHALDMYENSSSLGGVDLTGVTAS